MSDDFTDPDPLDKVPKDDIGRPSHGECVQILRDRRARLESHHCVAITDAALHAAAKLADRHIADRPLPDAATELVDEAAARVRIKWISWSGLEQKIESARREKDAAIEAGSFEKAADLHDRARWLTNDLRALDNTWRLARSGDRPEVGEAEVAGVTELHTR